MFCIHRNNEMMEVIKHFLSCSFVRYYQLLATKDIKDGSKMMREREIDGWKCVCIIPPIAWKNYC